MMDLPKVQKIMAKKIDELEEQVYFFDKVLKPRMEADRRVLEELKADFLKVMALQQKVDAGVEVSQEDVYNSVPVQFR